MSKKTSNLFKTSQASLTLNSSEKNGDETRLFLFDLAIAVLSEIKSDRTILDGFDK